MIVYLNGTLKTKSADHVVIATGGVGYQVFVAKGTLESLPTAGETVELTIHTVVREDSWQLFGFSNDAEKLIFLKLIQVSSIGPKMALNILSGLPAHELANAIYQEDLVQLTAIPGIGKKTAERLIVDLKDKILDLMGSTPPANGDNTPSPLPSASEAVSALTNLGYSPQEAKRALQAVPNAKDLSLEALVREGLKALS